VLSEKSEFEPENPETILTVGHAVLHGKILTLLCQENDLDTSFIIIFIVLTRIRARGTRRVAKRGAAMRFTFHEPNTFLRQT
jgi:hypothetical protein